MWKPAMSLKYIQSVPPITASVFPYIPITSCDAFSLHNIPVFSNVFPGVFTGFFSDVFPSDGTMALGSTQPLIKMSTRNIPGGKGRWCVRLTTYHHTVPLS